MHWVWFNIIIDNDKGTLQLTTPQQDASVFFQLNQTTNVLLEEENDEGNAAPRIIDVRADIDSKLAETEAAQELAEEVETMQNEMFTCQEWALLPHHLSMPYSCWMHHV